ncbi:MAG: hypothetical protein OIF40_03380 [Mangrovicoccus sp.]|nr:hypothetical protein [Mangrovicoccus sp.]
MSIRQIAGIFALATCGFAIAAPLPAGADEITDALEATREAYEAGSIVEALQELSIAQALLQAQKTAGIVAFLPEAPDGWTREVDTDMAAGMMMFGGGTGAEARYIKGGEQIELTLMADSPMIGTFAGLMNNPAMLMASGGKLEKIGGQRFSLMDGEYSTLVGNRILVQARGSDEAAVKALLETIPYGDLLNYAP